MAAGLGQEYASVLDSDSVTDQEQQEEVTATEPVRQRKWAGLLCAAATVAAAAAAAAVLVASRGTASEPVTSAQVVPLWMEASGSDAAPGQCTCCDRDNDHPCWWRCSFWGDPHFGPIWQDYNESLDVNTDSPHTDLEHMLIGAFRVAASHDRETDVQVVECPYNKKNDATVAVALVFKISGKVVTVTNSSMYVNDQKVTDEAGLQGLKVTGDYLQNQHVLASGSTPGATSFQVASDDCCSRVNISVYLKRWPKPKFYFDMDLRMDCPQIASVGVCSAQGKNVGELEKDPHFNTPLPASEFLVTNVDIRKEICGHCFSEDDVGIPAFCKEGYGEDSSGPAPAPAPIPRGRSQEICETEAKKPKPQGACPENYPMCMPDGNCMIKECADGDCEEKNAPSADEPPADQYNRVVGYNGSGVSCETDYGCGAKAHEQAESECHALQADPECYEECMEDFCASGCDSFDAAQAIEKCGVETPAHGGEEYAHSCDVDGDGESCCRVPTTTATATDTTMTATTTTATTTTQALRRKSCSFWGDPHWTGYAGANKKFNFFESGAWLMSRSTDRAFEVWVMGCPYANDVEPFGPNHTDPRGEIVMGVAVKIGDHTVEITQGVMLVDGQKVEAAHLYGARIGNQGIQLSDTIAKMEELNIHGDMLDKGMHIESGDRRFIIKIQERVTRWHKPGFYFDVALEMEEGLADGVGLCSVVGDGAGKDKGTALTGPPEAQEDPLFTASGLVEICQYCIPEHPDICDVQESTTKEASQEATTKEASQETTTKEAIDHSQYEDTRLLEPEAAATTAAPEGTAAPSEPEAAPTTAAPQGFHDCADVANQYDCPNDPKKEAEMLCHSIEEDSARADCEYDFCASGCDPEVAKAASEEWAEGEAEAMVPADAGHAVVPEDEEAQNITITECPDDGLLSDSRCWFLSQKGGDCRAACGEKSMVFSLATPAEPILPKIVSALADVEAQGPWAVLECYAGSGDDPRWHTATPESDHHAEGANDPGRFMSPTCSLACPCVP